MTTNPNSGHPQPKPARTRNSETPGATRAPSEPGERNCSEPKNARTRVSENQAPTGTSADRNNSNRANTESVRARDSEKPGEPGPSDAGDVTDCPKGKTAHARGSENQTATPTSSTDSVAHSTQAKPAHPRVSENTDTDQAPLQVVAQRGEVTGTEREFLANGFGKALRTLRDMRGLTQHQVRGLAGISVGYLSMLERGHRRPTHDAIHAIVRALAPTDQQPELVDYFIKLAGDSIRESTARKKRRATSRAVVREAAFLKSTVAKLERQAEQLRDTGKAWLANDLEKTATSLREQLVAREEAARAQLKALGDDPDDPSITYRRAPKHFRKRSYGPR